MPNWVDNTLRISGAKSDLEKVRAQLENGLDEGNFLWNIVHPSEEEMADYKAVIGANGKTIGDPTGWYYWNISHWGTKWDGSDISVKQDEEGVCYFFNTAWSPPTIAMVTLSEQFPEIELSLRFIEEQGWGGESEYKAGEESMVEEWDIPDTHKDSIKYKWYCWCESVGMSTEESPFDDCPREEIEE